MAHAILREKAVLYLRMSSGKQETSIPAQRAELRAYAERQGFEILREYEDQAISGDDTARRTGFLKMRDDAGSGEFSVVLCWDQDRFGRFDPIEAGFWILPFRDAGVRLETIAQGKIDWLDITGRLAYVVQQEGKHAFLRDLSRNILRGFASKLKAGECMQTGDPPFGYRHNGERLVVEPEEAELVREIFRRYLKAGMSTRAVAQSLNREGIKTSKGKGWCAQGIRRVLSRQAYAGDFVFNKRSEGKYYRLTSNSEILPANGKSSREPIVIPNAHEPIISRADFDRTQTLLTKRRTSTSPAARTKPYLLTGLLRCANCGSPMIGQRKRSDGRLGEYRCLGNHNRGSAFCSYNHVREDSLVELLAEKIEERYSSPEAIARLKAEIKALARPAEPRKASQKALRDRLAKIEAKIDAGLDRVLEAPSGLQGELYTKLDKLQQERDSLRAEIDAGAKPNKVSTEASALIEEVVRLAKNLRRTIEKASPEEIRELFGSFVDRIEFSFEPTVKGKRKRNRLKSGIVYLRPIVSTNLKPVPWNVLQDGAKLVLSKADLARLAS